MTGDPTPGASVAESRAVLFGVHAYSHFAQLDGVRHNAPALRELLVSGDSGGLPDEHCVTVAPDSAPGLMLDAVGRAADDAQDLLLVYYAGHGHFVGDRRNLYLGTKESHGELRHHSVPYDDIRTMVGRSKARHRVVIVDSCFSGLALHMGGDEEEKIATDDFAIEGACVLTSAAETQRSLCLPEGSVFSLELVALLRDGLEGPLPDGRRGEEQSRLTMSDLFHALTSRLEGRRVDGHAVPAPRMSTRNNGHLIPLARNRAYAPLPVRDAVPRRPHTASEPSRYFTGREDEIAELEHLAAAPPALCLVHGRGGQGKSELVRAVAARTAHLFPGGCLEVDLRGWTPGEPPRDPYAVIAEQLRHMGYRPDQIPDDPGARSETWRLFLEDRQILLLLDNARDVRQLRPLLPGARSHSLVLVTSRSELPELPTDRRHALGPLLAGDCVAAWHRMGVPGDTRRLGELAERIGCSPLALGPLATRLLRGASVEAVLEALSGPERYRVFGTLDAAERSAFTMAYENLNPALRALVRHCAWHPGPDFGPDSIAAMACIPPYEAEVRLTDIEQLLIRKNGRYSFHDLSLEYAREAADRDGEEGERTASRERLYAHLRQGIDTSRDRVSGVEGGGRQTAMGREWLDVHDQELLAGAQSGVADGSGQAADLLLALARSLYDRNRYADAARHYGQVLDHAVAGSPVGAAAVLGLGDTHRLVGMYLEATTFYQRAHTLHTELGDPLGQAAATLGLGKIHAAQGRDDDATTAYREAHTLYTELGDRPGQAKTTLGLADCHCARGRLDDATTAYQEAHTLYTELGDRPGQANVVFGLGNSHRVRGHHDKAVNTYLRAHTLYTELGDRLGQANATLGLGDARSAQGLYEEALAAYQRAQPVYHELGDRLGQANVVFGLGNIDRLRGHHDKAVDTYRRAHALYTELGNNLGLANTYFGLAKSERALGRRQIALEGFAKARELYAGLKSIKWERMAQQELDGDS
ncbi:caspase, EACC1-associated type [Streptomyces sp. NPDC002308]